MPNNRNQQNQGNQQQQNQQPQQQQQQYPNLLTEMFNTFINELTASLQTNNQANANNQNQQQQQQPQQQQQSQQTANTSSQQQQIPYPLFINPVFQPLLAQQLQQNQQQQQQQAAQQQQQRTQFQQQQNQNQNQSQQQQPHFHPHVFTVHFFHLPTNFDFYEQLIEEFLRSDPNQHGAPAASEGTISQQNFIDLADEQCFNQFQHEKCAICLENYQRNEKLIRTKNCNHHFHEDCGVQWFKMHRTCPICRNNIEEQATTNNQKQYSNSNNQQKMT